MKIGNLLVVGTLALAVTLALSPRAGATGAGDYLAERFKQRELATPLQPNVNQRLRELEQNWREGPENTACAAEISAAAATANTITTPAALLTPTQTMPLQGRPRCPPPPRLLVAAVLRSAPATGAARAWFPARPVRHDAKFHLGVPSGGIARDRPRIKPPRAPLPAAA